MNDTPFTPQPTLNANPLTVAAQALQRAITDATNARSERKARTFEEVRAIDCALGAEEAKLFTIAGHADALIAAARRLARSMTDPNGTNGERDRALQATLGALQPFEVEALVAARNAQGDGR